jgi:D-alanyl-D-alanine carboxypeptidase
MKRPILIVSFLMVTLAAVSQGIQAELEKLVRINDIPGINFSIIYPDGKQENYAAGYSDVDLMIPMSDEYRMFSGSIGKTYAAAVIYQMVDEGKLSLEDRFIDFFPDTEWLKELANMEDITVEMLLTHTSGLPRYVMVDGFWDYVLEHPDKVWTYKERMSYVAGVEAQHPAGKGWDYSDTNYILLGMLLELLSGNELYNEISERILDPFRLDETYPSLSRNINKLSMGYSSLSEWGMPRKVVEDGLYIFNPQMEWTGGGFYCTTSDLARWAKLYYDGGIFSDALKKKMTAPCRYAEDLGANTAYGMGSFIYSTAFGIAWGHTGTMPGYNSIFVWFPDKRMAMALQVNCDYAGSKMSLVQYLEYILRWISQ